MEKIYHIYVGERCLFHSIEEDEFKVTWKTLNHLVGLMRTDYSLDDLSFEELTINKEICQNSSY